MYPFLVVRIEMKFNVTVDELAEEVSDAEEMEEGEVLGEDEVEVFTPAPFDLSIVSEANPRFGMNIDCTATDDSELQVNNITFAEVTADGELGEGEMLHFDDLTADVQTGVLDFMHALGIDDRTALFVQHHSRHVRLQQHGTALAQMHRFFSPVNKQ